MKASQRLCTAFIQQYTGASSSIERPLAYYRWEKYQKNIRIILKKFQNYSEKLPEYF